MKPTILSIFMLIFFTEFAIAQFVAGSGTETDPYQIETLQQLQYVRHHLDKHFLQTANIDASETKNWNNGKGFDPLGNETDRFSGVYDGNNHSISGLHILREEESHVGLFGYLDLAMIKNLNLIDAEIEGNYYVGGLAGTLGRGEIVQSSMSGKVSGFGTVGGLIGYVHNGDIKASNSSAQVGRLPGTRTAHFGGLVGFLNQGNIVNSHASGNVSSGFSVGGLVGRNDYGVIVDCYASGDVSGQVSGGLIGYNVRGVVVDSHATGQVSGSSSTGTIVGFNIKGTINKISNPGNIYPVD